MSDTSFSDLQVNVGREQPVTLASRYLGDITELMTVEERGQDRLTVTNHPVEYKADISDHAYMEPFELTLRMMATESSRLTWYATSGLAGKSVTTQGDYLTNLYEKVRKLQTDREPITIQTGKRLYHDMLIANIEVTTDEKTEHTLILNIGCRQVIIVSTSVVPIADPADQADPQKTSAVAGSTATSSRSLRSTSRLPRAYNFSIEGVAAHGPSFPPNLLPPKPPLLTLPPPFLSH